jgi:hypothetical protein
MNQAPGRLIIATFASLIAHQQVVQVAAPRAQGRHRGPGMVASTGVARELGYLDIPDGMLVDLEDAQFLPRERSCPGHRLPGQPWRLNRLAAGTHRSCVSDGDTVVLSSHTIPGNEEMTSGLINRLFQQGADVYYAPLRQVHVSGHASQDELRLLIQTLRPRFFVPVHGELRHLVQHARLAHELGIPRTLRIEKTATRCPWARLCTSGAPRRKRLRGRVPGGQDRLAQTALSPPWPAMTAKPARLWASRVSSPGFVFAPNRATFWRAPRTSCARRRAAAALRPSAWRAR